MNHFNNALKFSAIIVVLIILTFGYVLWERYLGNHFVGMFDEYGLPSRIFRTGWPLLLDAWPLWFIPTLFILVLVQCGEYIAQRFINAKRKAATASEIKKISTAIESKEKMQIDFTRALEIEGLKQQVDILKKKYFEEHQKSQEIMRDAEETSIALQTAQKKAAEAVAAAAAATAAQPPTQPRVQAPTNAHNEAVISSLKADNKKLQKQITELQEDLEQSNALIEKLLETQGN